MPEPKTRPTDASVADFLGAVANEQRRADGMALDEMLREASGQAPVMWGASMVGYGELTYAGSRGKQATWPVIAFSPRKTEFVLYLNTAVEEALFERLGLHRRGVGCLYLKRLSDIDRDGLRAIVDRSIELAGATSPERPR